MREGDLQCVVFMWRGWRRYRCVAAPAGASGNQGLDPTSNRAVTARLPSRPDFCDNIGRISLPRKGCRVGLRIVLFEDCSAFTRVTACTLALSPSRDTHSEGFSQFVTPVAAPVASGWSVCRVGFTPTGKRRLLTAHTHKRHRRIPWMGRSSPLATLSLRLAAVSRALRRAERTGRYQRGIFAPEIRLP